MATGSTDVGLLRRCPFEELSGETRQPEAKCPFHNTRHKQPRATIKKDIKVNVVSGTFTKSGGTAQLLRDIGGGDRIRQMTTRFYAHTFKDETLNKFIFEDDSAASHGQRLGNWIIQKMGGEGDVWSNSGRHGMRTPSHARAWHNEKRDAKDVGTRFKLDDCRIWMRMMFLSAREVGLDKHEPFWNWYVGFIRHFVAVYEGSAPAYAKESAEWSANQSNVTTYENNGYKMVDVIGIGRRSNVFDV